MEKPKPLSNNDHPALHATYVVGGSLKDPTQLKATRFSNFDFLYVMAGPAWEGKDFDLPEPQVLKKLVTDHAYPAGDSGEALVPDLIARAHRAGTRVLVSIPGSDRFSYFAGDAAKRAAFARVVTAFVKKHDYDGVEIDWEHTIVQSDHIALLGEIRRTLNDLRTADSKTTRSYCLTTALPSSWRYTPDEARALCSCVDWVNIMTYDMGGGIWGDTATHNTPLNAMKSELAQWLAAGFPREKLCIGLANYGFIYRNLRPGEKSPVSLKEKGRYIDFTEAADLIRAGWTESYDPEAQASYYFSPDGRDFMTIDSVQSIGHKLDWVLEERFRGAFWWVFHADYYPPAEGETRARHPLLDLAASRLGKK
jgi:chitinase